MRLVNDHVLPVKLFEDALFSQEHLVRSDDHVPSTGHHSVADKLVASLLVTNEAHSPVDEKGRIYFTTPESPVVVDVFQLTSVLGTTA